MPRQVKFLLGAMITAAALIVFGFFVNAKGLSILGANISEILKEGNEKLNSGGLKSNTSAASCGDIDKDGLCDKEEPLYRTDPLNPDTDGDGFLDGEEISSGHDPLIPGPNDLLSFFNPNITQKLATLTVSGLYEGSLRPENPEFDKSINTLVFGVLDDALDGLKNVEIGYEKLSYSDSSRTSQEKYIKEISPIYEQFLTAFTTEMKNLEKNMSKVGESGFTDQIIINYYEDKALEFNEISNKLSNVTIPENWKNNHLSLLQIVGQLTKINAYTADGENDPIKALIGLNRLIGLLDTVPSLTNSYISEIKNNNLSVEKTIFEK